MSEPNRAVVIRGAGGPEVLAVEQRPMPQLRAREVLVRVRAVGLNRADLLQRQGEYPAPPGYPADIPGLEFAGEVVDAALDAKRWRRGQRVFGIIGGGAHATFVATHEDTVAEVPPNLTWAEAGGVPEVFITAHDALSQAGSTSGENVLIHSVASGVGIAAVQLVRVAGGVPYGTTRSAAKIDEVRKWGLQDGVAISGGDFKPLFEAAKQWLGGAGFDVALDLVGGAYTGATTRVMAKKGRIVLIGTVAGEQAEISLGQVLGRRLHLIGTVLRARPLDEKIEVTRRFAGEVVPLLASGRIKPAIDRVFPLEQVREAHAYLESNATVGKVVLEIA